MHMKKYIIHIIWVAALVGVLAYAVWEPTPQAGVHATGVHIMADGSVMSNEGSLPGATVLPDGTIRMKDGSIVTPVADYRQR